MQSQGYGVWTCACCSGRWSVSRAAHARDSVPAEILHVTRANNRSGLRCGSALQFRSPRDCRVFVLSLNGHAAIRPQCALRSSYARRLRHGTQSGVSRAKGLSTTGCVAQYHTVMRPDNKSRLEGRLPVVLAGCVHHARSRAHEDTRIMNAIAQVYWPPACATRTDNARAFVRASDSNAAL